ncbi:MAG: tRNA pseudouridine(55) synthase TruB [Caldisericaceae bacterium]
MEKLTKPFLLISKPRDITSSKLLNEIKSNFGKTKIGHTGTLDPIATGLLVVALGYGTRLIPYLDTNVKEYFIKIVFGMQTDTDDITGNVIQRSSKKFEPLILQNALSHFIGDIEQYPPSYSAKKVAGKELYKYARLKQDMPQIKPVNVTIFDVETLGFGDNCASLRVVCSKGTYMRSLARDIGTMLGTFGTIAAIARTRVGKFSIKDATTLSNIKNNLDKGFLSAEEALDLPVCTVGSPDGFKNGIDIPFEDCPEFANLSELPKAYLGANRKLIARSENGNFLGIASVEGNSLHPEVVVNENY